MIDQKTLKEFDKLYDKTYQNVLKYVICNCSNLEDVKDIVQNVYLELLKNMEKRKDFPKSNAYIIGITKNKVKEYYRFKYRDKIISFFSKKEDYSLIDNIPNDIDILKDTINKDDIELIWNFLKKKKIVIGKIFYLYYYADMSIKKIAESLDLTESNVKHYLYRTLNELKELMQERGNKDDK